MWNAGLDEAQAGIKTPRRIINKLRYADYTTLMAEREEEPNSPLVRVKEESEKVGLKFSIQKTKIMASGPITSWQIDEETLETVTDFILGGSKITADGDCSHEIKSHLLLGRKSMTSLDSILKSRDITLPTNVHLVKAMVFSRSPVWMWQLDHKESWVPKNWYFWTAVLENTLQSPLDSKEIKSILKEISTDYSLEGLMLTLKLQNFGHLMRRTDSLEKTLMLGKIEGRRRRGQQRMRWLEGITDSMDEFEQAPGVGDGQGSLACCSPWGCKE